MLKLRNLLLFISCAIWHGTPLHLWSRAWREIQADHRAEIRKAVWELKKAGRIHEDREGRLWNKK